MYKIVFLNIYFNVTDQTNRNSCSYFDEISEFAKKILYMDQMFQFQFKNAFTQINNYV